MIGVCGWYNYALPSDEAGYLIRKMGDTLGNFPATLFDNNWALAANRPHVHNADDIAIAITGHPRWLEDSLPIHENEREFLESVIAAYRNKGIDILDDLGGDFLLAIIDHRNDRALLATDRMGHYPLSYFSSGKTLLFGSNCDAILHHPAAKNAIDPQAVFNYLYFHVIPGTTSIYQDWHRLAPGHYLMITGNRLEVKPYWSMPFREDRHEPFLKLKKDFLSALESSVSRAVKGQRTGAFLSGGTDSSTITGMMCRVMGEAADCYSIGFDVDGYDETEYARIAAQHFGARHHIYNVTPDDVVAAIPIVADTYDFPYGNSSAIPTYFCAKMAKEDGIQRLLGGDGGDELFGGNTRYARQKIFEYYSRIPESLRNLFLEPLLLNLPLPDRTPLLGKVRRYIRQAKIPMPQRMESYNLIQYIGTDIMMTHDFLSAIDINEPENLLSRIYSSSQARSIINRMLALDFQITLSDNDLPKVIGMCDRAGVDVVFPLLCDEIVSFSASLHPDMKLRGTTLRYFFKKALNDFLPEPIIRKKKHGFGLPFGAWLENHGQLREITCDSLSGLKERGIVDSSFIDTLLRNHLGRHSSYYGTLIWVLMMLEQWFIRRAPRWSL